MANRSDETIGSWFQGYKWTIPGKKIRGTASALKLGRQTLDRDQCLVVNGVRARNSTLIVWPRNIKAQRGPSRQGR